MPSGLFPILSRRLWKFASQAKIGLLSGFTRTLLIFVLGLFFLGYNFPAHSSSVLRGVGEDRDSTEKELINPGRIIDGKISPNQTHLYQLQAPANQFLNLVLNQNGVDLLIRVTDPNGLKLIECTGRDYGSTPILLITEKAGLYLIEVRLSGTTTATGTYTMNVARLRRPTATDRQRIAGEGAFIAAETLRAQGNADSLNEAVRRYEEAAAIFHTIDSPAEEATAIKSIGQTYFRLGEYKSAVKYFQQALQLRGSISETQEEGEILNHLGYALVGIGNNEEGLKYCTAALRLFQRLRVPRGEAQALTNLGEVYYAFSKLDRSIEYYTKALPLWAGLGDLRGQGQTLMNFGIAYSLLRDPVKSIEYLQKALTAWRQVHDRRGEALTLTVLGTEYTRTGEWQKASDVYYQALEFFQASGDRFGRARAYNCLAYLKSETGQQQAALDLYNQSLPLFVAIGRREAEAGTRLNLGQIYLDRGEKDRALEYFTEALRLARELKDPLMQAYALTAVGKANEVLLRTQDALANYYNALALFKKGGDRLWEARSLSSIGYLYANLGQTQKALGYFDQALPLARIVNKPREVSSTLYNLARMELKRGNPSQARARIEEALQISETLRTKASGQELRASYFATVHKQYEFYVDLLIRQSRDQPADNLDSVALEVSERARARSLLDSLNEAHANIQDEIEPALLEQERSLRSQLNDKAAQRMPASVGQPAPEAAALAKELDGLSAQYERVRAQIKSSSPRYAALTQPEPLTTAEIQQQVLDDGSLLLEYMLGDERSYLWAVTRTEISTYVLPPRVQIEEAAQNFYKLLTANQPVAGETLEQRRTRVADANAQISAASKSLSKLVLEPVAGKLGTKRLLIVPDGALQYIPFQVLSVPATTNSTTEPPNTLGNQDEQVPLLVNHEIVYQPSASALALVLGDNAQRPRAPNSIAVFANPVFEVTDSRVKATGSVASQTSDPSQKVQQAFRDVGLGDGRIPALPASGEEAEAIMALAPWGTGLKALGFDANRAAIMKPELAQYRIVHFATHGFVDYQHPELSGLVLSLVDRNGQPQEGFVRLHDIYNLKLSADLVVLSACNTGLGKDVKGEGLIGLTRGFMYAGAGGVAASLWKVDDDATAELMKHFYEGMFQRGLTPAAALREAQLGMWKQKRWHSPYYWGAFVLQGQYNQHQMTGFQRSPGKLPAVAAGVGITLFLLVFLFLRRRRKRIL